MARRSALRASVLLGGTLALAACAGQAPPPPYSGATPNQPNAATPTSGTPAPKTQAVALLVPLTGAMAPVGAVLANAAKLAFGGTASGSLDIRDTMSTPQGAAAAAQAAITAGDGLILGPLTSAEAQAVAPVAEAAQVNVLAFTNDPSVAAPGFWPLGITPVQQVHRIVQAAAMRGRTQIAALLPDNQFGHTLSDALNQETAALGEPGPSVTFYPQEDFADLNTALAQLSDFQARGGNLQDQIHQAQAQDNAAGQAQADQLQHQQIAPPSFNALFVGATSGEALTEINSMLPYYEVAPPAVQVLGPALWQSLAPAMGQSGVLTGALFAAPDPATASAFVAKYQSVYGAAPPAIAEVAFDAAAIARVAGQGGGYGASVLTDPSGFAGADGLLQLQPGGQVLRGLAVLQVAPGGPIVASPAPATLGSP